MKSANILKKIAEAKSMIVIVIHGHLSDPQDSRGALFLFRGWLNPICKNFIFLCGKDTGFNMTRVEYG